MTYPAGYKKFPSQWREGSVPRLFKTAGHAKRKLSSWSEWSARWLETVDPEEYHVVKVELVDVD